MKFAYLALLGAASANFLQDSIVELDDTTALAPVAAPASPIDYSKTSEWTRHYAIHNKVGELQCQPHEGYIVWNLKPLDAHKSVDYLGAGQAGFSSHSFGVELCEPSFDPTKMPEYKVGEVSYKQLAGETPIKHGNAYWSVQDDTASTFTPEYSFLSGNFQSNQDPETEKYTGWSVTYASHQNCGTEAAPEPFVFVINGVCDESSKSDVWSDYTFTKACAAEVTYTGKSGCIAFNGNAFLDAIKPYTGVLMILIGAVMTFYGSQFILILVSGFVSMIALIMVYFIIANLFFDNKTAAWMKVIVLLVALSVAVGAFYVAFKFAEKFAVPIIAGAGGAFGFKLISNIAGLRNEYAAIGVMVLGIVAGVALGFKFNKWVKTIGTAFLGAYIFIRGTGYVFGGFPEAGDVKNMHKLKGDDKIIYYFIGFITFFIAGAVVQHHFFQEEDKKEDDTFVGQDEDEGEKKCGCF